MVVQTAGLSNSVSLHKCIKNLQNRKLKPPTIQNSSPKIHAWFLGISKNLYGPKHLKYISVLILQ